MGTGKGYKSHTWAQEPEELTGNKSADVSVYSQQAKVATTAPALSMPDTHPLSQTF